MSEQNANSSFQKLRENKRKLYWLVMKSGANSRVNYQGTKTCQDSSHAGLRQYLKLTVGYSLLESLAPKTENTKSPLNNVHPEKKQHSEYQSLLDSRTHY